MARANLYRLERGQQSGHLAERAGNTAHRAAVICFRYLHHASHKDLPFKETKTRGIRSVRAEAELVNVSVLIQNSLSFSWNTTIDAATLPARRPTNSAARSGKQPY